MDLGMISEHHAPQRSVKDLISLYNQLSSAHAAAPTREKRFALNTEIMENRFPLANTLSADLERKGPDSAAFAAAEHAPAGKDVGCVNGAKLGTVSALVSAFEERIRKEGGGSGKGGRAEDSGKKRSPEPASQKSTIALSEIKTSEALKQHVPALRAGAKYGRKGGGKRGRCRKKKKQCSSHSEWIYYASPNVQPGRSMQSAL